MTAQEQYTKLSTKRQQFLRRAHLCSKLTIPTLIPFDTEQNSSTTVEVEQPWQSLGSTGVNTLAAKMLLTLLPPNTAFFKYVLSRQSRQELLQMEGEEADAFAAEIEAGLQKMEREVLLDMERTPLRTILFSALKHLLVAGNVLVFVDRQPRAIPMYRYVVQRDASGNLLKIIVREVVALSTLPDSFVQAAKARNDVSREAKSDDEFPLYTVIEKGRGDKWTSYQEVFDREVPGTRGIYDADTLPWLPLRMVVVDGEDYGRSYCEELYGDLQSTDDLTKALVQGGMIASKLLWLVNPNGFTDEDDLQESANGDFVPGRMEDVTALRVDKMSDFTQASQTLSAIIDRLMRSFLMTASVQRDGERVTATEIQMLTQEIEDTLGGYYSVLSQELQQPIAKRWKLLMEREGALPEMPSESIEVSVVTGIDALGRGQDLSRLRGFVADILQAAQALPQLSQRIDDEELAQRFANGHGVDISGLLKTNEQLAAEQQQAQQAAMQQELVAKGTGPAISAMASAAQGTQ